MIIRDIKRNPDGVLAEFDWFNDYDDTVAWCRRNFPEVVERMNKAFDEWLHNKWQRMAS